ncbi:MAG: diacylglycerol kinase family protein [Actinomycetota bacterium]|nr:diacylglycerol kinase family protein [Actinomycetota bacterium]
MSSSTARHIVVAINPRASFGKNEHAGAEVAQLLAAAGHDVVALREDDYPALEISAREALRPASVLVVVGGDGMVHLGANLAREKQVALGIIPAGTGNDLARHLGLPLGSIPEATAHLIRALESNPRQIDVGVATSPHGREHPFACVFSAGFDALVNERANTLRFIRGRHRYTVALLIELAKLRPITYTLTIDGVEETASYLLVAVANSQSFGGGMKVTPDASLVDGMLDVFTLDPLSRLAFLRIYPRVFQGLHVSDPRVHIRQARSVRVESDGIVAYADGERLEALPLQVSLEPACLAVYA